MFMVVSHAKAALCDFANYALNLKEPFIHRHTLKSIHINGNIEFDNKAC